MNEAGRNAETSSSKGEQMVNKGLNIRDDETEIER